MSQLIKINPASAILQTVLQSQSHAFMYFKVFCMYSTNVAEATEDSKLLHYNSP